MHFLTVNFFTESHCNKPFFMITGTVHLSSCRVYRPPLYQTLSVADIIIIGYFHWITFIGVTSIYFSFQNR